MPKPLSALATTRCGVTLVEMLIVVALMGIVVAMVVPMFDPGVVDQLQSGAMILSADLDYARGLAIGNNSQYTVTFDKANNRYFLHHTGANRALDSLPKSPFLTDGRDAVLGPLQIADFDEVLLMGPRVSLYDMRLQAAGAASTSIEFGALGSTNTNDSTVICLTCGEGKSKRYVMITVSPVTGLATIGDVFGP